MLHRVEDGGRAPVTATGDPRAERPPRRLRLDCPCGERITGESEDELVENAYRHLRDQHPKLAEEYTPEDILMLAF